ncbi:MAG: hypothetical protein E7631_02450 [Ruminococcaceae bacterium]|nr:hypothetical protein [Oscillospiraceae bacterium]
MKHMLKTAAALLLAAMMALCAAAEDTAPADPVNLPRIKDAAQVSVTSSLASDGADLTPLYDDDNATTAVFEEAADGVTMSVTAGKKFRLSAFVLGGCDDAYTVTLSASQDGETWKDVKIKAVEKDGYMVYYTQGLGVNYRYYRLNLDTEEGALELGTAAFFARRDFRLGMAF